MVWLVVVADNKMTRQVATTAAASGHSKSGEQREKKYPVHDIYATAIETEFGICVEMKNCALVEDFLENDVLFPREDVAPLTLSWLSSRWHDSQTFMNRNVQKMPDFHLNNSRFVYQTTINYRRSLKLREGNGNKSLTQELFDRGTTDRIHTSSPGANEPLLCVEEAAPQKEPRARTVQGCPKKMWIRHYYLSNGKNGETESGD